MITQYMTGIQHIGIPTNDMEKTIAFYHGLGFETAHENVIPDSGDRVAFLKYGNLVIETYENHQAVEKNGAIDHIAIDVTDVDAIYAELKKAGYQILDEGVQSLPFWANGVRFFTILGPNKEKVEFNEISENFPAV